MTALHLSMGSTVLKRSDPLKLYRVRLREGLPEKGGVALYRASEIVASVERHALRYPMMTPNDRDFESLQWNMKKIGMPAVWDITKGNANVVVGVIDTGVDIGHPDLAANIWTNPAEIPDNHSDDDGNRYIDDVHGWDFAGASGSTLNDGDNDPTDKNGHGTHIAGIIAAVGNNDIGVAGIGWNIRVMPLKVQADDASLMEDFDIIAAIDYAITKGVRIVNCSFGSEASSDQLEYEAFVRLRQAGILAVCAAGNTGIDNDSNGNRIYPASYDLDNIISVAASLNPDVQPQRPENLWASSNYGKTSVDLMAPGEAIRSTCICPSTGSCDDAQRYCDKSGTSMAAPHVSGVAGLILSRMPSLGYARVRSILLGTVDPISSVATKLVSGGRLNAAAALRQVCLPGDVTGNSATGVQGMTVIDAIGLDDVILALRIASGMSADDFVCRTADVDGDDRIGLAEAINGLRVLSGLGE